jgi:hypothetical protein
LAVFLTTEIISLILILNILHSIKACSYFCEASFVGMSALHRPVEVDAVENQAAAAAAPEYMPLKQTRENCLLTPQASNQDIQGCQVTLRMSEEL